MVQTSRRNFLATASLAATAALLSPAAQAEEVEPIIDIHQHLDYSGRTDEQLLAHQKQLGITHTILLPAGRFYGLEAKAAGNERVEKFAQEHRGRYWHFANEVPYLSDARQELERGLKAEGIGIGEQKFMVDADSGAVKLVAKIAEEFQVPVLLHFQHGRYNMEFKNFHRILDQFPKVNFIGHAQTWWANIDAKAEQEVLYPKGPVTAGGLTDRWLADYENMYADMSAGSGLNAFLRDEHHAREFIARHQDKLLFGSDCSDAVAEGTKCLGFQIIAMIRRLSPSHDVERKLLFHNAHKLFGIG